MYGGGWWGREEAGVKIAASGLCWARPWAVLGFVPVEEVGLPALLGAGSVPRWGRVELVPGE